CARDEYYYGSSGFAYW
nr:immunoglobulin heavy chain junction region [Mus musculus]